MSKEIKRIVLHCSDSSFGTARMIDDWHRKRGWSMIGYHFVVLNGKPSPRTFWKSLDGSIEIGRPLDNDSFLEEKEIGAGAYGFNRDSVHICLIGVDHFTMAQIHNVREVLIPELLSKFGLGWDAVVGHYELNSGKTCPNLDMATFRDFENNFTFKGEEG